MTLAAHKLVVALSGRPVLRDVDLELRPGELTVIVGPNGAGKSTLLKVLTGLLAPTAGSVFLDGSPLSRWPLAELARRRAMLTQNPGTGFPFTVRELVGMGARAAGHGSRAADAVARCLAAVDLTGYGGRLIQELSGGETQRAHIARVLCQLTGPAGAGEARWLFLDEPTNGLDIAHQLGVLDLARAHAGAGGGAVAILHDLTLASLFADRVVIADKGGLIGEGTPADTLTEENIASVFGSRLRVVSGPLGRYIVPKGPIRTETVRPGRTPL